MWVRTSGSVDACPRASPAVRRGSKPSSRRSWNRTSQPAAAQVSRIASAMARLKLPGAGWPTTTSAFMALLVHRAEEVLVGLGGAQLVEQELDGIDGAHRHEDAAQHPHLRQRRAVDQQLLLAGARLGDVDGREGALVGNLAVEDDFRVTGALEFLEDPRPCGCRYRSAPWR